MMTPERTDLYQVLGVAPDADEHQVDQAFRVLARRHHPDIKTPDKSGRTEPDSEPDSERFREILAAYAVLRDPVTRAAYDRRTNKPITNGPATSDSVRRPTHHIPQQFGPGSPVTPLAPLKEPALRVGPVRWTASTRQTTSATDRPGDPATDRRRAAVLAPEPATRQVP